MRRPLFLRSSSTVSDSGEDDLIERLNTVHKRSNGKVNKMTEQTDERMARRKETSGIWVLLIFVVLLAAVVTVSVMTP